MFFLEKKKFVDLIFVVHFMNENIYFNINLDIGNTVQVVNEYTLNNLYCTWKDIIYVRTYVRQKYDYVEIASNDWNSYFVNSWSDAYVELHILIHIYMHTRTCTHTHTHTHIHTRRPWSGSWPQ